VIGFSQPRGQRPLQAGAQGVKGCLGLFYRPAHHGRKYDDVERASLRIERSEYDKNLYKMWRTTDWRTGAGFLPWEALEVRELRVVLRGDARTAGPAYSPDPSSCTQVKMILIEQEDSNVEKMLGTDRSIKLMICDCGGLRLASGPVTIHFTREEFQVFAESVGRLATIVAQPSLGQAVKSARSNPSEVCH